MCTEHENMETGISEVTDEELYEIKKDKEIGIGNGENNPSNEGAGCTDEPGESKPNLACATQIEERSVVMNNNFILPMESVETRESMEDESRSKKQKSEKKDGRFYKFVKRHFLQRKNSSNDVKEIRIVPDGDEFKWARRSAGSAASRSSNETTSSDGDRLEVVHDMAEEYIPEV
ncbi:uncharacterized protein LOC123531963 isoform X1 [Mercenaria mercenaria]|uniref:uncharacterized protein LOC123531963 isoform X1 n=1 Tax=Mercenaria mercenaria TaxID=6596 RepID=UPI00234EBA4E|nr:uncharacterized protein LOC123531963 isoform X1 [Mercenaria mercenaria]